MYIYIYTSLHTYAHPPRAYQNDFEDAKSRYKQQGTCFLFVLFVNDIFPWYFQRWKALAIIRALLICGCRNFALLLSLLNLILEGRRQFPFMLQDFDGTLLHPACLQLCLGKGKPISMPTTILIRIRTKATSRRSGIAKESPTSPHPGAKHCWAKRC